MERNDELWQEARHLARGFLRRFEDPDTRSHREDLAQEAVLASWQWVGTSRGPECLPAALRTITRRLRCRLLRDAHRRRAAWSEAVARRASPGGDDVAIAGRRVPRAWVLPQLRQELARLPALDRTLLVGVHEGFCSAELAARCRRSEAVVRVRIHRARCRVRRAIERAVLAAEDFDC